MRPLAATLFLCLSAPLLADTLTGRVVAVTDGDTVRVLTADNVEERIRLAGIDAPERKQPFGQVSKQHLSDQAFGQEVTVEWDKRDRYGRIVGKVLVGNVDADLEQLRAGLAWHYLKYAPEQAAADRANYSQAEDNARAACRGLWADPTPVPPWEWRHPKPEP